MTIGASAATVARMRALLGVLALALTLPASSAVAASAPASPTARQTAWTKVDPAQAARAPMPKIHVRRQVRDLSNPWDVKPISGGRLLITERDTAHLLLWQGGETHQVRFPSRKVWVSGETGLMSMEVDPDFAHNGRFYTCSGWQKGGGNHDIRVNAWRLNDAGTRARLIENVISGFPTSSGRHGGCRLLLLRSGALLVGTGDAATGTNPQDLTSLGGKTLRLDPMTGKPWPSNKFINAQNRKKRYIHTFGHRNVQGLAQRKDGSLWSIEHGSDRDDEVNKLVNGGDYGWNPVPGYNESVPMTDQSLPGRQINARWKSGSPTLATSGAAWVSGKKWGRLNGTLAVAALKANRVVFMKFNKSGHLRWTKTPAKLQHYGRLRSVVRAPNGDLLITSDNDTNDFVIRVSASR
jgi:glucose/arabinose dehydrogenase